MGTGSEGIVIGRSGDPMALDSNFRLTREGLDRLNSRWISAAEMEASGATKTLYADRYAAWSLADGVDTNRCAGQTDIPSWWGPGTLIVTGYFASTVGSINPFRIRMIAAGVAPGAALPVTDATQDVDIPGPALADGLVEHAFSVGLTLGAFDRIACVHFLRLGAHANDTHAAPVLCLGARLTFNAL